MKEPFKTIFDSPFLTMILGLSIAMIVALVLKLIEGKFK